MLRPVEELRLRIRLAEVVVRPVARHIDAEEELHSHLVGLEAVVGLEVGIVLVLAERPVNDRVSHVLLTTLCVIAMNEHILLVAAGHTAVVDKAAAGMTVVVEGMEAAEAPAAHIEAVDMAAVVRPQV